MGEGDVKFGAIPIKEGDRRFAGFMWDHISDYVRAEFEYEGIKDAGEFYEDVMSADHRTSFWRRGAWVASMWSGWMCDEKDGLRSFGCVVRKPEELASRMWLGLNSRAMADDFFMHEPESAKFEVVVIPKFMRLCIRHARISGLTEDGFTDDGKFVVMSKDLTELRKAMKGGNDQC